MMSFGRSSVLVWMVVRRSYRSENHRPALYASVKAPPIFGRWTDMETMTTFRDYLTSHGLFSTIRASRGEDIFAACGMLSTAKKEDGEKD